MTKKYQRKSDIEKFLNISSKQLIRAEKKAKERHPLEDWIFAVIL